MDCQTFSVGLLLLCCCVVLSGSQNVENAKRSCCGDKQFEVKSGGKYLGKGGLVLFYMPRMSVDFVRRQSSFDEMTDKYGNISFIIDYKSQKMYSFKRATQRCSKLDYPQPMEGPCTPEDARFMGQSTLGYGKASLTQDNYYIYRRGKDVTFTAYFSVTSQGCYPVSEGINVQWRNGLMDISMQFTDYRPGIRDPAVFRIPSFCDSAVETDSMDGARLYLSQN